MDEIVYCISDFSKEKDSFNVDAYAVKLFDGHENRFVGLYMFWNNKENEYWNPKDFLKGIVDMYGEAKLQKLPGEQNAGLVCNLNYKGPEDNIEILHPSTTNYNDIKLDLLEMRASDPKPLLSLEYNIDKKMQDYESERKNPNLYMGLRVRK